MIELCDVSLEYGRGADAVAAVDGVSVRIESGESVALVGPSGCGKTTLLFAVAGLLVPRTGSIEIDGEVVVGSRGDVSLILQNAGLLPWKTVWQNANLSLRLSDEYPRKTAASVLEELGIAGVRDRFPAELSEGMKRRVGIARALSMSPSVMLMDEPLASLDTLTKERVQNLFLELWTRHRFSLVLVTHDIEEAAFLGGRIVVLTERPARIKQVVDNAAMGTAEYRGSLEFQRVVAALRKALEA